MPLSWISGRRGAADVDTLVAHGKYVKAARTLRAAFEGRQPTLAERLRYADLLVLADRGEEALPVLLGVADEQARYGFYDKATEALRRAEAIDPREPRVREHLCALREQQSGRSGPTPEPAPEDSPGDPAARADGFSGDETVIPESELEPADEASLAPWVEGDSLDDDLDLFEGADGDASDELRPLLTESELEADAVAAPDGMDLRRLHAFLLLLGRTPGTEGPGLGVALFADFPRRQVRRIQRGVRRRRFGPGDVIVTEGDPGHTVFLIARGSVRILVRGGHGQPFDVRLLDEGDSFGEVAVLSGWPRSATAVAATACDTLEIGRSALETLLAMRPEARRLLRRQAARRAQSAEEKAVRALPPEAADPERAAEALRAHFGGSEWSFRVRLHLAQLMLDVGRQEEALAILAGVAEDLARHGHAQKAIAVLKKVEWIRRRGGAEIEVAPPRKGRRRSPRPRPSAAMGPRPLMPPDASAATRAAFREWVGSMLRQTHALAARPAAARDVEEEAEADGEDAGHDFARQSA
jgi:CRP-like cAMP-binding protein